MKKLKRVEVIDWDFDEPNVNDEYEQSMARYNAPITKHTCDRWCKSDNLMPYYHEKEDFFDDYGLSLRQRELMRMEIERSRGKDSWERQLIRMFVAPATGLYHLRLETGDPIAREQMGDLKFEDKSEMHEMYNYAVDIFQFDKRSKVIEESDDDPFSALDDDEDDVFGGLNDEDDDDPFADLDDDDDDDPFGDLD